MRCFVALILTDVRPCLAGLAAHVNAQIALPPGPAPAMPRAPCPQLPGSIGAEPLVTVSDTLAQVRLDRITMLLRDNRADRIEPDRNGQPRCAECSLQRGSTTQ